MSLFRFTVTHLRVAIVGLNLFATLLIAALPVYRLLSPHDPIRDAELKTLMAKKGDDFKPSSKSHRGVNYAVRVGPAGQYFRQDPVVIAPVDPTPEAVSDEETSDEPRGPDELPPGPLEEKFVFIGGIFWDYNSERNVAVLEKKGGAKKTRPQRRTRPRSGRGSRTATQRNPRAPKRRTRSKAQRKQADDQQLLNVYQRWVVDEEEGPVIFVLSVTPDKFIYEEQGKWIRYALKRKRDTIYEFNPEDGSYHVQKKDDEEEKDGDAEKEKPTKHFYINHTPRTPREAFDKRKREYPDVFQKEEDEGPAKKRTTGRSRSSRSRASTKSSRRTAVKKPTKAEIKELNDTLKQIPAKDRKKLENALKGK